MTDSMVFVGISSINNVISLTREVFRLLFYCRLLLWFVCLVALDAAASNAITIESLVSTDDSWKIVRFASFVIVDGS